MVCNLRVYSEYTEHTVIKNGLTKWRTFVTLTF